MNEDIEELLRSELAGRAQAAPPSSHDDLAELAIARAGRIKRRRIGAAAGGLCLLVFGAAAAVWLPWNGGALTDQPPAATSVDEAQDELEIEFAVERDGSYGVVNADDEYIPLSSDQRPFFVERLRSSYVVSSPGRVEVRGLDGERSAEYEVPVEEFGTVVRGDAEEFATSYLLPETGLQRHHLFSGDADGGGGWPVAFDLAPELDLQDWNESLLVFSGPLTDVTGGAGGTYHFNVEYDWGLETVAAGGFESAVITDTADPDYVCVADFEPGVEHAESEECGYLDNADIENMIAEASADFTAPGMVTDVSDALFGPSMDADDIVGDEASKRQLFESEYLFTDPLGRWEIAFGPEDETWALLDTTGDEPWVSRLRPPEGAFLPVVSHN